MINSGIIEFYRSVVKDSCDVLSSGTSTRVNGEEKTKKLTTKYLEDLQKEIACGI